MTSYAWVLACVFGFVPEADAALQPDAALKVYETAKERAGRDAQAHVRLALWCESQGLTAERLKHLAIAVLLDPKDATARGLMGLVANDGRWERPEIVGDRIKADEALAKKLAEYNRRRARLLSKIQPHPGQAISRIDAAVAHEELGSWCKQAGLPAEATAHFTSAVVLNPYRDSAWKRLGYVRHNGRWMSPEQVAAERQEAEAQKRANDYWEPLLTRWKEGLAVPDKHLDAEDHLAGVTDPRSVRSVMRVFGSGKSADLERMVKQLSQIEGPAASRELASVAIFASSAPGRSAAIQALKGREPREFAAMLVELIRFPMTYQYQPVGGPGQPGGLLVETPRVRMLRTYDAPTILQIEPSFFGYIGYDTNGLPVAVRGREIREGAFTNPVRMQAIEERTAEQIASANSKAMDSQARLMTDIRQIEAMNADAAAQNDRIRNVLQETAKAPDIADDLDAWRTWWYDRLGYKYERPKQQLTVAFNASPQAPPPAIYSCFIAGTPVRTREGHRPIDQLLAGDHVLTQDVLTGELSFQPVLVVHHNAPGQTLKVAMENGETLVASVYHRFWRAGKGWAMARDLTPGDVIRTLSGLSSVTSVTDGPAAPLYNLDVAKTRTFYVGNRDALVHDNTLPEARVKPFDAPPSLAASDRARP
jgi:hypothetical protein